MLHTLLQRCSQAFTSRQAVKQIPSPKPALEALEDRSLLDASAFVRSLYANILDRPSPTNAEVNGWVSQIQNGMSLQAVSAAFIGSNEHFGVIIQNDYSNFFGRPADQAGLNFWVQQMENGMSQDQVASELLSSEEFLMRHGSTNQEFIQGLYQTVLHRNADAAGLAYWNQQLSFETQNQNSHQDISMRFLTGDEAHQADVDAIFAQILHRSPDANGDSFWTNFLNNGGSESQVIAGMVNSSEYLTAEGVPPQTTR